MKEEKLVNAISELNETIDKIYLNLKKQAKTYMELKSIIERYCKDIIFCEKESGIFLRGRLLKKVEEEVGSILKTLPISK